jgi:haloalkane dehalogenase
VAVAAGAAAATRRRSSFDPTDDFTAHGFVRQLAATPAGAMAYYEAGAGQPLVFLHGIGDGASAWIWSKVAPAFSGQYRVIAPDWVGWGVSEHPQRWLLKEDYVAELDALLQLIGEPALVVAQSQAAGFAAELAYIKPELFQQMVLITPSGGQDFGKDALRPAQRALLSRLARNPATGPRLYRGLFHRRSVIRSWLRSQGFYDPAAVSAEIVEGFVYSARQPNAAYAVLPFLAGDLRFDFAADLRDLTVPATILWGSEEREVGRDVAERLAAVNPNVPLRWIAQARATPELERPAQTIAAIQQALSANMALERTV